MKKRSRVAIIATAAIIVLLGFYHFFGIDLLSRQLAGNVAKATFVAEDAKLERLFDLFSGAKENPRVQCNGLAHAYFSSTLLCYAESFTGPALASTNEYRERIGDLKKLLDTNGWRVANDTELVYSPDSVSNVAYFKNIGDISCNLKISLEETSGKVSINIYNCSKEIELFDINRSRGKLAV